MKSIVIEATSYLPRIILDKNLGVFEFLGRSIPKNPDEFYFPVFDWVDSYVEKPNESTNIVIDMDYMNTASHKCLSIILHKFNVLANNDSHFIKVSWKYDSTDEDMLEMGEELADCCDIPFEFIPYLVN